MFLLVWLLGCGSGSLDVDDCEDADQDGICEAEDCDDADPFVFPGAAEACDGLADEDWDEDADGVASCMGDCDDADPDRTPANAEICNGIDDDCDGLADEGFDQDGDRFTTCEGDCDDADPARNPGLDDVCNGGIDDDCDPSTMEVADLDGDGLTICAGDCDDNDPERIPGATELCDGLDQDCDGVVDDDPECHACVPTGEYLLCNSYVTFDGAAALCQAFGGDLASFPDRPEMVAISQEGLDYTASAMWIGLSDAASEGTWVWSDGTVAAYAAWAPGEPNGGASESCALTNWGEAGRWNDAPCSSSEAPFICAR